ncbi:MAG: MSMEG_0565 family glycosyltransferase [Pseudonocardiales bacterium]|nr:MSMEG_0565 family glycosyltransferase [Pseudonocardiales bacterium]MBV9651918.1 MSMEG_0565 family glycosyltransferase [Pseudonocardiales bacterium]
MRIALLTYSTRPRGSVVHTLALAEALVEAGQQVTVWALGRAGDIAFFRPVQPGMTVRIVPFPEITGEAVGMRILRSIRVLGDAFDPSGYDVVHAQDCISANAVPRCIRTVHHLDEFSTPELAACHERAIVNPVAHVCVSAAVAAQLHAGWGITATVIPNGVDAARFACAAGPGGAAARAVWGARLGRYVLTVGGIEPRKGSLTLLEAYALSRRDMPDLQLAIAGGETLFDYRDYRARWEQRAQELAVEPLVLGPVTHAELPALVAAAGVFAFPSTKEGFGLAAMEALAAGVPLVVSNLPVFREIFTGAARFADGPAQFAAALMAALAEPDGAGTRRAGRALVSRYTWPTTAQRHLDLYRTLT